MLKYLKPYKKIENHKLLGQIYFFESIEFNRYMLLKFETKQINLNNNYNLYNQKSFLYNDFLEEKFNVKPQLIDSQKNKFLSKRRLHQISLLNTTLPIPVRNSQVLFEKNIWKKYLNHIFVKNSALFLDKLFSKSKFELFFMFHNLISKFLLNSQIRNYVNNYNSLKIFTCKNFFVKIYKIRLKLYILSLIYIVNILKKTKNNHYLEYSLNLPIQLYIYKLKEFNLKTIFSKTFFIKNFFFKISTNFFISFFFKNFTFNYKYKNSIFFKYHKFFKFWKKINLLYFKLNISQIKFKNKKNMWRIKFLF